MADPIDFIFDLQYEDIPEKALESARLCILDAVGCMIGGMENQAVLQLAEAVSEKHPGASVIAGTALTSTRAWSAFVNTHACSYFDLDDGHRKAQGHPGGIIVPLSLAAAAEMNCSGREMLAAVVAGYEIAVRSALVIRESGGPRKGSGGWSILGAAAAVAKLTGLSKEKMRNALGLAEYYAPQAPQDRSLAFPSSMKEGMAWSAHAAASIIELAELGFDAMVPSLADSDHCGDLGSNWEICSTYFKMYGCCRFAHPVLDGLEALIDKDVDRREIESITVTSFAKAMLLNHLSPKNPVAAMYSIPFVIGCFLVNGRVGVAEMTEKSITNAQISQIARKVSLVEDPGLTEQFPLKCRAKVTVAMKNGQTFESGVLSAKGDPDNPYSMEEMAAKFKELTRRLGRERSRGLLNEILELDQGEPVRIQQMLRPSP